jgi:hypothetical protein
MDNQLKIKLTIKFETTYLFDYFKHEKNQPSLLVLFISQMNGQKIDSLTIDKKLSPKFYCTNSSFDWWYLLLNSVQIIPFRKNLIPFLDLVLA